MRAQKWVVWAAVMMVGMGAGQVEGGMAGPPVLREWARLRLENISFFLFVLLVCAGVVMGVWNWLRKDFPRLPRLSFFKSLALVVLWGLMFVIVLAMISGARELMTPGAWEKDGAVYKLSGSEEGKPYGERGSAEVAGRPFEVKRADGAEPLSGATTQSVKGE